MLNMFFYFIASVATKAPEIVEEAGKLVTSSESSANWTIIISVIGVCLTATVTLIKIFGSHRINESKLRHSEYIGDMKDDHKNNSESIATIREELYKNKIDIEKIKEKNIHFTRSMQDLKDENKELVNRLDILLKRFMEFIEH